MMGSEFFPDYVEFNNYSSCWPGGKEDKDFVKKPGLAIKLIHKTLSRKYRPSVVLVDGGYGNNYSFLQELEKLKLNYIGGLAQNGICECC